MFIVNFLSLPHPAEAFSVWLAKSSTLKERCLFFITDNDEKDETVNVSSGNANCYGGYYPEDREAFISVN